MSAAGVDFLIRYAESEGALVERTPDGAVLVLPEELQGQLEVNDVLSVTEDPEVARDDDVVLLSSGHPLLSGAAQAVLEEGDVGCAQLARPAGAPPDPSSLEGRAREQLYVEHGRVDVAGAPRATHVPVLRVGALVTFSVSLDERFQEVDEVWVDVASGEPVPDELVRRLLAGAEPWALPGELRPAGVDRGVDGAHRVLAVRADGRAAELGRQTSKRLRQQLEVVDDYYERVIGSLEERRARASEERARMLAAQAEATEAEWSRRRTEVTEDLTPTFTLRPFRMHLLFVPAYEVPAVVRRGERAYPLSLTYLPLNGSFLLPRCPTCGSSSPLTATKVRLGCRACVAGAVPTEVVRPVADPPGRPEPAPVTGSAAAHPPAADAARSTAGVSVRPPRGEASLPPAARSGSKVSSGRVTPKGSRRAGDLVRTGSRLATEFWERLLAGEQPPSREILPCSPLAALLRLYGVHGPALVLAMEEGECPDAISSSTIPPDEDGWVATVGHLETSAGRELPFTLHWRPGKAAVMAEIEAFPLELFGRLLLRERGLGTMFRDRFSGYLRPAPVPRLALAQASGALLAVSSRRAGLAFASRCLAAWWYMEETAGKGGGSQPLSSDDMCTAAAVEAIVAKRAGLRFSTAAVADAYGCAVAEVRAAARLVGSAVRRSPDFRW